MKAYHCAHTCTSRVHNTLVKYVLIHSCMHTYYTDIWKQLHMRRVIACTLAVLCSTRFRFYNRLPEVKKQREEEKRKRAYSANRDKAKEYHEVHVYRHSNTV